MTVPQSLIDQFAAVVRAVSNIPTSVPIEMRFWALKLVKDALMDEMRVGTFGSGETAKKVFSQIMKRGLAETLMEREFHDNRRAAEGKPPDEPLFPPAS